MNGTASMAKNASKKGQPAPTTEVAARPARRSFTATYKLDILARADKCIEEGQTGELLRSEGLYSSHLTAWRRLRDAGALRELGKKRGRKAKPVDKEKLRLVRENERLRRALDQAEKIIDIQKKVAAILETPLATDDAGSN